MTARPGATVALLAATVVALGGCRPDAEARAPDVAPVEVPQVVDAEPVRATGGTVTVAIPAQPPSWLAVHDEPVVAADLAALWGLPLYRWDAHGRPVPALVASSEVSQDGRTVRLRLRDGQWSDGAQVTSEDVVATVEALRDQGHLDVPWLDAVEAVDDRTAVLRLAHPARWQGLLGTTGVLPAHVLADDGLQEVDRALSVTGGPFRLDRHDPGLDARFVAHPDGPLGRPGLDAVEVVVVPSFDTALGLLADGDLDAIVGHLAIRPDRWVADLRGPDDVTFRVAAPSGGTRVLVRWHRDGALGDRDDLRRAVVDAVDVDEQVEAFRLGDVEAGPVEGAATPSVTGAVDGLDAVDVEVVVGREQEALSATARLLEAQVRGADGRMRLESLVTPHDLERAGAFDGEVTVRRDPPWPDLGRLLDDTALREAAEGAAHPTDPAVSRALEAVAEQAREHGLYRVRVTHVWHPRLRGLEPSAWPGAGLSSAHRWHLDEGR